MYKIKINAFSFIFYFLLNYSEHLKNILLKPLNLLNKNF